MADLTRFVLLTVQILIHCQLIYLWTLITYLFFSVVVSMLFQTCMLHKDSHNYSGLEIVLGVLVHVLGAKDYLYTRYCLLLRIVSHSMMLMITCI